MVSSAASSRCSIRLTRFQKDERGLSTVEYAILLVLIAVATLGAWRSFSETLYGKIKASNTEMQSL